MRRSQHTARAAPSAPLLPLLGKPFIEADGCTVEAGGSQKLLPLLGKPFIEAGKANSTGSPDAIASPSGEALH